MREDEGSCPDFQSDSSGRWRASPARVSPQKQDNPAQIGAAGKCQENQYPERNPFLPQTEIDGTQERRQSQGFRVEVGQVGVVDSGVHGVGEDHGGGRSDLEFGPSAGKTPDRNHAKSQRRRLKQQESGG